MDQDTRVYPICCTSMYCGEIDCTGCSSLPERLEFEEWRNRTNAECVDYVWSPLVYKAQNV